MSGADAAVLAAAQELLARGQVEPARQQLQQALRRPGPHAELHYLLAVAGVLGQRADEALQHAQAAITEAPASGRYHFALGRAHKLAGRLPEAVAAYRQAVALQPGHAEAWVSLGIALKHGGDVEAAVACYERAIELAPRLAVARANLAYAQAALAEREAGAGSDEAPAEALIDQARQAVAMEPQNPALHFNLGLLQRRAQQRTAAIDSFNHALGLAPGDVACCLHLGRELVAAGHSQSALVLYRRWLEVNPPAPAVMRQLSDRLSREGSVSEALHWCQRAVALEPEPLGYLQLCNTLQQCRRLAEALAAGRQAIALSGGQWQTWSIPLLVASYQLADPQAIAEMHAAFGRALSASLPPSAPAAPRPAAAPGGRLRIAYLSADLVAHSVAFFIGPLLERHDRERFEVRIYFNRGFGDEMTERLRGLGHHWVDCEHLSDEALARRIRDDGIHMLVDLSGHTAGARLRTLALAPAPLQLSYLGYPTASGVQQVQHRISDSVIDPGDMPDIGCESPLTLPRSMFCWRAPEQPPIAPPPSLARGHVTFGSFNNHAKISSACLRLWARVLQALPGSRLLLKSAAVADPLNRAELQAFMAHEGIGAERLDLRSRLDSRRAHFEAYNEVDVALDPFPYNGATTTCEALWMGVPVISLHGRTHAGRMGASILRAAGQPGWVAPDEEAYLALAIAIAEDSAGRAQWRENARAQLQRSELMDEAGFVRDFEATLMRAWQQKQGCA